MSYLTQSTKMGTWKQRILPKKSRGKQESGRSKGLIPPAWAKACAKQSRAYKNHPDYERWCSICTGDKIKWSSK